MLYSKIDMGETFGDKIRALRRDRNLTLKELSEKSRIGITYLSKIENNRYKSPKIKTIGLLAKALGIDEDTKQELFCLARQYPPDLQEDIAKSKAMFEVFRSAKNFSEQEFLDIVQEIRKKKNAKNIKK